MKKPQSILHNIKAERDAHEKEQEWRRNRFRILVCINGSDSCYDGLSRAAEFGRGKDCDLILLYVRRVDQGLNSGGLQVRVARQNMLDWGLELPGIDFLKRGLKVLEDLGYMDKSWKANFSHRNVLGDPLGDNKVEYHNPDGKSIVLKLKTAPDVVSGILDQYELGPYNLIIMGPPKRWRNEYSYFRDPSTVQKVAMLAPCSTLATRGYLGRKRGFLICFDGSEHSFESMKQAAVLAHLSERPVTIFSIVATAEMRSQAKSKLQECVQVLKTMGITNVKTRLKVGDPVEEILKTSDKFAMVVVSDNGKSRLKRFLTGSVAFDTMGKSETSVLNVR